MTLSDRISLPECTIQLYGSHHTIGDVDKVNEYIESFSPDLICMEADPKMQATDHTIDVSGIEEIARKNNIEFWHIDTYDADFKMNDKISDLSDDEKESVTGYVSSIEESDDMRDSLSEIDKEAALYNTRRESAMTGSIVYARDRYESILIVVGAAHYSNMYRNICSLF